MRLFLDMCGEIPSFHPASSLKGIFDRGLRAGLIFFGENDCIGPPLPLVRAKSIGSGGGKIFSPFSDGKILYNLIAHFCGEERRKRNHKTALAQDPIPPPRNDSILQWESSIIPAPPPPPPMRWTNRFRKDQNLRCWITAKGSRERGEYDPRVFRANRTDVQDEKKPSMVYVEGQREGGRSHTCKKERPCSCWGAFNCYHYFYSN